MSGRTWVYSDPHFYHKNIVKFTNYDGSPLRPWDDVETMTEEMITWYNELVSSSDRVYILGDVAFSAALMRRAVGQMNGRKCLIPGNHEPVKMRKYFDLFDDVRGYVQRQGFIMSHIPLHTGSMDRWKLNIHGHLHNNQVQESWKPHLDWAGEQMNFNEFREPPEPDPRYYCACVERTNYRPKLLDEILHERGLK